MENIAENMYTYVTDMLCYQDVYLMFDRYKSFSIKSSTRTQRAKNLAYRHKLGLQNVLPAKDKVLTCTNNKVQLIDIVCEYVTRKVSDGTFNHKFVITGLNEVPTEVLRGSESMRHDFRTTHEEADVILVQQVQLSKNHLR